MGRKEFYEKLDELKDIRHRLLESTVSDPGEVYFDNKLILVETEIDKLKLLHQK